ncbi:MAG: HD domain-containing protein [Rikenellaceae bacterium]
MRAEVKKYIEQHIIPQYAAFDAAHSIDHAQTVIEQSDALARYYAEIDREMAYVIAAFHDVGLCEGREFHHIASGKILRRDQFIASHFTAAQIEIMIQAIEDHRASAKDEPRSLYGRIVAEADRIISVEVTLRRTVQYGLKLNPQASADEHYARFCDHLQEKYAKGGYLKLYIPYSENAARLEELREVVANPAELRRRFDLIFKELS